MPLRLSLAPSLVWGSLHLMLGLTWVVYALFLPKLVAAAGLPRALVPWLLVIDQLVFALTDPWAGAASDRAADGARRIGPMLAGIATLSAMAFLGLPLLVAEVPPAVLAVLLLAWAIGTAALRAPLAALLSRQPVGGDGVSAALVAGGLALAGVAGGVLVPVIGTTSPALAFGVVSGATALVAWLVVPAERWALTRTGVAARASRLTQAQAPAAASWWTGGVLLCAAGLLAMGQQLHTAVVAPAVLASVGAPRLAVLFWVGAALASGLYLLIRDRLDCQRLAAAAALIGCGLLAAFGFTTALPLLGMLHGCAGLAWGLVLAALIDAVLGFGRARSQSGLAAGLLFGLIAVAAMLRLALGALDVWSAVGPRTALGAAATCWGLTAALLLWPSLAHRGRVAKAAGAG